MSRTASGLPRRLNGALVSPKRALYRPRDTLGTNLATNNVPERYRSATKCCSGWSPSALLKIPIREACGYFRRPQKPLFERIEYPKSPLIQIFWTLNRLHVTTFAPVGAGKGKKCDPSEPARAGRTLRGPPGNTFWLPAPLAL